VLHRLDTESHLREAGAKYRELLPIPPDMNRRILRQVRASGRRPTRLGLTWAREVALAAVLVSVVAAAGFGFSQLRNLHDMAQNVGASGGPAGSVLLPQKDLDVAGLSGAGRFVIPFHLQGQGSADTLTMVGAYGDSYQTLLFFRGAGSGLPTFYVYDDSGWINAYTQTGTGVLGDRFLRLASGPHTAGDGLAHITITGFPPASSSGSQAPSGRVWFSFFMKVYSATRLDVPKVVKLGSWSVTLERLAVTPAALSMTAIVDGASSDELGMLPVQLLNDSGTPLKPLVAGISATVGKQDHLQANARQVRLSYLWARPAPGTYVLRLTGAGAVQSVGVTVPLT
jgi:hypothetical protein